MPILPPDVRVISNKKYILCVIRRKWLQMTPEEKVRQFTLQQLIHEQGYPAKYISVEKKITLNDLSKRYDIVVYNTQLEPRLLIECKAEYIELKEKTLQQIAAYNLKLQVPYLMVTNGFKRYIFGIHQETAHPMAALPEFSQL